MAEKKEKQYVSDNAQLMAEWDFDKTKLQFICIFRCLIKKFGGFVKKVIVGKLLSQKEPAAKNAQYTKENEF